MREREPFVEWLRALPTPEYDVHPGPDRSYTFHIRDRMWTTVRALDKVLRQLSDPVRVLDIGCFPGPFLTVLPALWPQRTFQFQAAGLAENEGFLQDLSRRGIPFHRVNLDPQITDERPIPRQLPPEAKDFDLILATEVVEHLLNPLVLLGESHRVARPGAFLVITTPNLSTWYRRIKFLLKGQSPSVPLKESIMVHTSDWRPHIREFTMGELCQMLTMTGWEPRERHHYQLPAGRSSSWRRRLVDRALESVSERFPGGRSDLLLVAERR